MKQYVIIDKETGLIREDDIYNSIDEAYEEFGKYWKAMNFESEIENFNINQLYDIVSPEQYELYSQLCQSLDGNDFQLLFELCTHIYLDSISNKDYVIDCGFDVLEYTK